MVEPQSHRQLSLPTGTETLQLREAARHRRISRTLEDLFLAWGYDPMEMPLVDYFDVYRRFLAGQGIRHMYRAVDRQGEILVLRSDVTLFLAKQLGTHLSAEELPVRVFYDAQIVRAEERDDISNNEYQQAGIELVGVPGMDGDAEVLLLAAAALDRLSLGGGALHIGSHEIIRAVAESFDHTDGAALREAVRRRETAINPLFTPLPEEVRRLLAFIGPLSAFERCIAALGAYPALRRAAESLAEVVGVVEDVLSPARRDSLRIDTSELGAYSYYTGVAFGAYLAESNAAVIRGGRYDRLLEAFGFDAPSVGFSMYTRKLPASTLAEAYRPVDAVSGSSFADRIAEVRRHHAEGRRARL